MPSRDRRLPAPLTLERQRIGRACVRTMRKVSGRHRDRDVWRAGPAGCRADASSESVRENRLRPSHVTAGPGPSGPACRPGPPSLPASEPPDSPRASPSAPRARAESRSSQSSARALAAIRPPVRAWSDASRLRVYPSLGIRVYPSLRIRVYPSLVYLQASAQSAPIRVCSRQPTSESVRIHPSESPYPSIRVLFTPHPRWPARSSDRNTSPSPGRDDEAGT
jgi:hypothetical protein